jgi:hypothetical protein
MEKTKNANDLSQREYNELIEEMAIGVYTCLPKAGFTSATLRGLAENSSSGVKWEKLPTTIKLCMIRLAMAMMPRPTAEEAALKEQAGKEKTPEVAEKKE